MPASELGTKGSGRSWLTSGDAKAEAVSGAAASFLSLPHDALASVGSAVSSKGGCWGLQFGLMSDAAEDTLVTTGFCAHQSDFLGCPWLFHFLK